MPFKIKKKNKKLSCKCSLHGHEEQPCDFSLATSFDRCGSHVSLQLLIMFQQFDTEAMQQTAELDCYVDALLLVEQDINT